MIFSWLLLSACAPGVLAVVDPSRSGHFLDAPYPSDADLSDAGTPDLSAFPAPENALVAGIVRGWADRVQLSSLGYGNNAAIYFRFEAPVAFPTATNGWPDDPVVLVSIDGVEQLPLDLDFVEDPAGDPFWAPNTLALAPRLGEGMRAGKTYVAAVLDTAGVDAPEGYALPDGVEDALSAAGILGRPVVATVFTVQDAVGDLRALGASADQQLPEWDDVTLRRVVSLDFAPGLTPSGKDAQVQTVTYEGGETRVVYLSPGDDPAYTVDLLDWPMVVYEADIDVLNYQDEDDRPYMSPGLATLGDVDRQTGWIEVDHGVVLSQPWAEKMRITVSLPKGQDGEPITGANVVLWDHGTSGSAYDIVNRGSEADDARALAQTFADAGWATVGRDATLYGARYPLIDEGYDGSLGFYNIVNLPAFRDNQRQTAVDGHLLLRYVQGHLNDDLPAGSINPGRVRKAGHSLGAVTSNLGLAMEPLAYEDAFLVGTGGDFSEYFLSTGLTDSIDPELIGSLFTLLGAEVPDEISPASVLGAAVGATSGDHITRLHPLIGVFQTSMDPSDPMSVARDIHTPTFVVIAPGDKQTPDFTAEALAQPTALQRATVRTCQATSDYDPHQCIWREAAGPALVAEWLAR